MWEGEGKNISFGELRFLAIFPMGRSPYSSKVAVSNLMQHAHSHMHNQSQAHSCSPPQLFCIPTPSECPAPPDQNLKLLSTPYSTSTFLPTTLDSERSPQSPTFWIVTGYSTVLYTLQSRNPKNQSFSN